MPPETRNEAKGRTASTYNAAADFFDAPAFAYSASSLSRTCLQRSAPFGESYGPAANLPSPLGDRASWNLRVLLSGTACAPSARTSTRTSIRGTASKNHARLHPCCSKRVSIQMISSQRPVRSLSVRQRTSGLSRWDQGTAARSSSSIRTCVNACGRQLWTTYRNTTCRASKPTPFMPSHVNHSPSSFTCSGTGRRDHPRVDA
jgi:hypothetical protein